MSSETKFKYSERSQLIIDHVVQHSKSEQLPVDRLSVTLIDIKTSSQASYRSNAWGDELARFKVV